MSRGRDILLEVLQERLLPILMKRGFDRIGLSDEEKRSHELKVGFPLGRLRRVKGLEIELMEIQLDQRGAAKFVINFGVAPPQGVDVAGRHFDQDKIGVSDLPEWYRLYSKPSCVRWFSPSRMSLFLDERSKVDKAVMRAVLLIPEFEDWFNTHKVGIHMQRIGSPIRSN